MSEMVERVARALHRAHYERGRKLYPEGSFEALDRFEREMWIFSARAAIAEMRDPTVEMVRGATIDPLGKYVTPNHAALVWQLMIDEALKDEKPPPAA